MNRSIAIVGAPSSIGIKPYDEGSDSLPPVKRARGHRPRAEHSNTLARHLDQAPRVLREQRLVQRLHAEDYGDVVPPPYRDFVRTPGRTRNEDGVVAYSRALAERVADAGQDDAFVLVLGGDCSIVLGALMGVKRERRRVGLAYVDAHADFATPQTSSTGSAASMCLGLACGRGDTPLARLGGEPLVRMEDVVVIGRRDDDYEPFYGQDIVRASAILDIPDAKLRTQQRSQVAGTALDRLTHSALEGFWIHVDADVVNPDDVPAVDSPEPGGLHIPELTELLRPLAQHPKALGLELTIYDPGLDPDRSSGQRLAAFLEGVLRAD